MQRKQFPTIDRAIRSPFEFKQSTTTLDCAYVEYVDAIRTKDACAKVASLHALADSQKHPLAMMALGKIYQRGSEGVTRDFATSEKYFLRAFKAGLHKASCLALVNLALEDKSNWAKVHKFRSVLIALENKYDGEISDDMAEIKAKLSLSYEMEGDHVNALKWQLRSLVVSSNPVQAEQRALDLSRKLEHEVLAGKLKEEQLAELITIVEPFYKKSSFLFKDTFDRLRMFACSIRAKCLLTTTLQNLKATAECNPGLTLDVSPIVKEKASFQKCQEAMNAARQHFKHDDAKKVVPILFDCMSLMTETWNLEGGLLASSTEGPEFVNAKKRWDQMCNDNDGETAIVSEKPCKRQKLSESD